MAPDGQDAASSGLSPQLPLRTFQFAMSLMVRGDTLVLMNGVYEEAINGRAEFSCGTGAPQGTPTAPVTLRSWNERGAIIRATDGQSGMYVYGCSHWRFEGLVVQGRDVATTTTEALVRVDASNNLVFRRMVFAQTNRYVFQSALQFSYVSDSLVEDGEFYDFHYLALHMGAAQRNVVRACYFASRGTRDVDGGVVTPVATRGDDTIRVNGRDNVIENCVSEGNGGVRLMGGPNCAAGGCGSGNSVLGLVSVGDINAIRIGGPPAGLPDGGMPVHQSFFHGVVVDSTLSSVLVDPGSVVRLRNVRVQGAGAGGISRRAGTTDACSQGDGGVQVCTTHIQRSLVKQSVRDGIQLEGPGVEVRECNSVGNMEENYASRDGGPLAESIADEAGLVRSSFSLPPVSAAPDCLVDVHPSSNMFRDGGPDFSIGATIDRRYVNGVLTSTRLWAVDGGAFPCGALVPGINTPDAGLTCGTLHQRLGVDGRTCPWRP